MNKKKKIENEIKRTKGVGLKEKIAPKKRL